MATPLPNSTLDPTYGQWQIENPGLALDNDGKIVKIDYSSVQTPEQQAAENKAAQERDAQALIGKAAAGTGASLEELQRAEAVRAYEARFQYGGWAGGAHEAADRYNKQGIAGQQRQGEQINYDQAKIDREYGLGARRSQLSVANMMALRAAGRTPSIAGMQANRAIGRAVADQSSIAAGARGPAALALAQQQAAGNSANAISGINQDAMVAAAQERERAEQAAFNAYSGMRQGDATMQGMSAQQAQQQAAINAAQRAQNDQYQLGMTQAEIDVQKSQLGAQGNKVGIETGQAVAAANRASAESMHDADNLRNWVVGGTAAAGGVATGLAYLNPFGGSGKDITGDNASDGYDAGYGGGGTGADLIPGNDGTGGSGDAGSSMGMPPDDDDPDPMSDHRAKRPASLMAMRAKGGPVRKGKTYLVGEEGPELIVPREPGHVLTAAETRSLVGERGSTAVGRALREGPREEPRWLDEYMARKEGPVDELDEPTRDIGEIDDAPQDLGDVDAPSFTGRYEGEIQDTSIRQPVSFERHNNPGLDRRIREMVQAQEAQRAMLGEPSTQRAIYRDSPLEEDRADRYARKAGPPSLMAMRARRPTVSDDRAKLAAAWKEGNDAAIKSARELSALPPEEVKRVSDDPSHPANEVAKAVREAKTEAYDEGKYRERELAPPAAAPERYRVEKQYPLSPEEPKPTPRTASFQREQSKPIPARVAQTRDAAPPSNLVSWSPMSRSLQSRMGYSDERTKVGTLGPQMPSKDMAAFARSMKGTPYTYRDEYAEREGQKPGEVNVGPVAQEVERTKVGRTIVKPDPQGSGMRTMDQSKLVKALGSVAADQQDQLDDQRKRISLMARRMGGGR